MSKEKYIAIVFMLTGLAWPSTEGNSMPILWPVAAGERVMTSDAQKFSHSERHSSSPIPSSIGGPGLSADCLASRLSALLAPGADGIATPGGGPNKPATK